MKKAPQVTVQNLDHLGLVAGIIDQIGIVEKINEIVGCQPGEIVSPGHAVKAMLLNGLGLVSAPLYLFSKFFEGKATEHLRFFLTYYAKLTIKGLLKQTSIFVILKISKAIRRTFY